MLGLATNALPLPCAAILIPNVSSAWMQVESETVKARSPLAATSRPGIADLDASSAPGPSCLGQPRRSVYTEPEEHTEADVTGTPVSAQHTSLEGAGSTHLDGPDADSNTPGHRMGGNFFIVYVRSH